MKPVRIVFYVGLLLLSLCKTGFSQSATQDSLVLVELYNSTNGPAWTNKTNWLVPGKGISTWSGIFTNASGRVTIIGKGASNLVGALPISLGTLDSLEVLFAPNNSISGTIPAGLGNLKKLRQITLPNNVLTGSIPAVLGNDTALVTLELNNNKLSGSIPEQIGNLAKLTTLDLSTNALSGSLPVEIGNLVKLQLLNLSGNILNGTVPNALTNLTQLNLLVLSQNQFNFSGLEAIKQAFPSVIYSPQADIVIINNSGTLSVAAGGTLANNTYKWYQDSVLVATIVGNNSYTFSGSTNYYVKVTNSIATGLTLTGVKSCSPSLTIGINQNPSCTGTAVTLTATPANGGTNPAYQWFKNDINVFSSSSIASFTTSALSDGDSVYCVLTSNAGCAFGGIATSNKIGIRVNVTPSLSLVNTGDSCLSGSVLTLNGAANAAQINWYNGASLVLKQTVAATVAGGNGIGNTANKLNSPEDVYGDKNGNIYVADYANHRIQKWAPGAVSGTTVAGTGSAGAAANRLSNPEGIFVDSAGAMYIADAGNNRIQKWTAGATTGVTVAGGNGGGSAANQFDGSVGVYVDGNGNIFVADINNNRIQKWTPGATSGTTVVFSSTSTFWDVFVDAGGNIFTSDIINGIVQKWVPGTNIPTTVAGGNGRGSAANQLSNPGGIFLGNDGTLYVADYGNNRVQKWLPGATAGITVAGGYATGSAASQLNVPLGLYVDGSSNIYVADVNNHRVQKWPQPILYPSTIYNPTAGGSFTAQVISTYGCSATSNGARVVSVTPSVTLTANTTIFIMPGTTYNFSATAVNGGSSPTYVFKKNSAVVQSGNSNNYSITGLQVNDTISCTLTSNVNCSITPTAISNRLIIRMAGAGIITTFAGGGADSTANNIQALAAKFKSPVGIFADKNGNKYIADGSGHRVRKVDVNGNITTVAGTGVAGYSGDGGQATAAQINRPYGIYADAAGNVFIGCTGDYRIRKVNPSGIISTFAGTGVMGYSGNGGQATSAAIGATQGITGDAAGNIYFTDFINGVVRKITTTGVITTIAGTGVSGYSGNGGQATAAQLGAPNSVSIDAAGNMYIGDDAPLNCVRKINPSGIISTVAGGSSNFGDSGDDGAATAALFGDIECAIADSAGNIFIADAQSQKIRKVNTMGIITTICGTGTAGFNGDSLIAANALVNNPWAVFPDKYGDLFIADSRNAIIRKITMPVTSTSAGNWSNAAVWAKGRVPDAATIVVIDKPVTIDVDASCWILNVKNNNVTIRPGIKINVTGH